MTNLVQPSVPFLDAEECSRLRVLEVHISHAISNAVDQFDFTTWTFPRRDADITHPEVGAYYERFPVTLLTLQRALAKRAFDSCSAVISYTVQIMLGTMHGTYVGERGATPENGHVLFARPRYIGHLWSAGDDDNGPVLNFYIRGGVSYPRLNDRTATAKENP